MCIRDRPETLGHAALLMTDLDNLKTINDTYGHDWGDQYLRQTGRCLAASTPPGTLAARLSGDEFMLLLYGYDSRDAVREELEKLRAALQDSASILPSGSELHISISGGVAWYPEDSTDFNTLKKYADFAMYQVKHSRKGEMKEFDIGMYNQEAYAMQTRSEFEQMLRDQAVSYHFQPMVSARNGRASAYAARVRPEMGALQRQQPADHSPRYVKVDISIIRSIDTNTDKQQFLTSLVDYARPRNILVLAEGVETTAELRKVLELGVDLLQGYCLARPAAVPPPLSKEAADIIHRMKRC